MRSGRLAIRQNVFFGCGCFPFLPKEKQESTMRRLDETSLRFWRGICSRNTLFLIL